MKKYKMYISLCKEHSAFVVIGICLLIIEAILAVRMPFLMNAVLDKLFSVSSESFNVFIKSFIIYILLYIVQTGIGYISSVIFKLLGIKNSKIISENLMRKIFFAVKKEPPQFSSGNAMQIMSSDAFNLGENGIIIVYQIIHTAINIIALFYYMWSTFSLLALLITIEFLFIMLIQKKLVAVINRKIMKSRELGGEYSYLINNLISNYFNYRKIRCFDFFLRKYNKQTDKLLGTNFSLEKTMYLNGLINSFVVILNFALIFGLGSYQLVRSAISVSTLVTFNMYANQFGNLIINIPNISRSAKEFSVSYERVMRMYGIECYNDKAVGGCIPDNIHQISIEDISFSYGESSAPLISNFSAHLSEGNIYCISGKNGCGKSTLLNLLTGEYKISSGTFKINNSIVDLYDEYTNLCEHISFCSSVSVLFNDTVKNNLLLGNNIDTSAEEKIKILYKRLGIEDCNDMRPDAIINDTTSNLSSGQKQKISLMRTLIDNKEIMIFDEPEKHLDIQSNQNFMEYLSEIKQNKIIIIVSHSKDIQDKCDGIINLETTLQEVVNEKS